MGNVNNFDVLKRMSAESKDIRLAPSSNILHMKIVKAGTQITIGVQGDVLVSIVSGKLVGCFLVWDKEQFEEMKKKMEAE